ncbi:DinB family protein [Pontibacter qinzhouensis]|uniref:DinB family protein n=1 Tax=Pontibacter qinzhouensis TaxID=2603253 RepID=A0A5C8II87_9BACT|nr:DinB family protein [Pontibacter qinzhouensis]TXK21383.1 DinB family protein [Pontibacter qinzhouensis]
MSGILKTQLLTALENKVEQHIEEAVRVFQNLPDHTLQQPAADGGWSIAQCLAHLNSYGSYYLPRLRTAFANAPVATPSATFTSTWLGKKFIQMMAPETGRKKYKASKKHLPPQVPDAQEAVSEFIRQQEELLVLLRQAFTADLDRPKIAVSVMAWLTMKPGDVLQFLVAHNDRHVLQAKRNTAVLEKPNSL